MAQGDGNPPGPVYLEFPTDVLRQTVPPACVLDEHLRPKTRPPVAPMPANWPRGRVAACAARRPLVVTGRGARARRALNRLLDASGAVYRHAGEPRPRRRAHASVVGAVRAKAMQEADLVLVVGRKLDYQMAYGSPAVFQQARSSCASPTTPTSCATTGAAKSNCSPTRHSRWRRSRRRSASRRRRLDTGLDWALRAEHVKRAAKHAEWHGHGTRRQGRPCTPTASSPRCARCLRRMRSRSPTAAIC